MEDRLDFEPVPASARVARSFVADHVRAWGWPELVDDARLLTSELVTNAAVHTARPFSLHVECEDERVRVEVIDHTTQPVRQQHPDPLDTHGRGLQIVDSLATDWGVEVVPHDGKVVWFELATPQPV